MKSLLMSLFRAQQALERPHDQSTPPKPTRMDRVDFRTAPRGALRSATELTNPLAPALHQPAAELTDVLQRLRVAALLYTDHRASGLADELKKNSYIVFHSFKTDCDRILGLVSHYNHPAARQLCTLLRLMPDMVQRCGIQMPLSDEAARYAQALVSCFDQLPADLHSKAAGILTKNGRRPFTASELYVLAVLLKDDPQVGADARNYIDVSRQRLIAMQAFERQTRQQHVPMRVLDAAQERVTQKNMAFAKCMIDLFRHADVAQGVCADFENQRPVIDEALNDICQNHPAAVAAGLTPEQIRREEPLVVRQLEDALNERMYTQWLIDSQANVPLGIVLPSMLLAELEAFAAPILASQHESEANLRKDLQAILDRLRQLDLLTRSDDSVVVQARLIHQHQQELESAKSEVLKLKQRVQQRRPRRLRNGERSRKDENGAPSELMPPQICEVKTPKLEQAAARPHEEATKDHPQLYEMTVLHGGATWTLRSALQRSELLQRIEDHFDAGTFPSKLASAAYHFTKHGLPVAGLTFEKYLNKALRCRDAWCGLVSRRISNSSELLRIVDNRDTYLVFSQEGRIISYRDRRAFDDGHLNDNRRIEIG